MSSTVNSEKARARMLLAMLPAMLPAPRRLSSAFDLEASAPSPSAASPDSLVIAADAAHGATQRVDHDADHGVAHGAARGDGTVRPGESASGGSATRGVRAIGRLVARLTICLKRRVPSTASVKLRRERTRASAHTTRAHARRSVCVISRRPPPVQWWRAGGVDVARGDSVISCGLDMRRAMEHTLSTHSTSHNNRGKEERARAGGTYR